MGRKASPVPVFSAFTCNLQRILSFLEGGASKCVSKQSVAHSPRQLQKLLHSHRDPPSLWSLKTPKFALYVLSASSSFLAIKRVVSVSSSTAERHHVLPEEGACECVQTTSCLFKCLCCCFFSSVALPPPPPLPQTLLQRFQYGVNVTTPSQLLLVSF